MSDEDMIRRGDALIPHSLITIWYDAAHEFLQECDDWLKLKRQNHPSAAGLNFTVTAQRREIARLLFLDLAWLSGGSELEQAPDRIATLPAVTPATSPGVTAGAVGEPMWCDGCRATGAVHCAHPDECGYMLSATAAADNWKAWIDDLPLPEGFDLGAGRLQDFITALVVRIDVPQPVATPPTALDDPKVRKLVEALTLAANRMAWLGVQFDTGSREFIAAGEWTDEARAALRDMEGA